MTTLDSSSAAIAPGPVSRFTRQWLFELAGLAGAANMAGRGRRTVVFKSLGGLRVFVHKRTSVQQLDLAGPAGETAMVRKLQQQLRAQGAARAPVILRLGPDQVLEKTLTIPSAAEDVLLPVLRNKLQRYVPWPPDTTVFGFEIVGRDGANGRLAVRLIAASRDTLDEAVAEVAAIGLRPLAVEFAASPAAGSGIMLADLRAPDKERRAKMLGRWLTGAIALALVCAAVGVTQAVIDRKTLTRIESEISAARGRLAVLGRANNERAALLRQQARLVLRKAQGPSVVQVLEALSQVLPDNAWLTELEVKDNVIRLQGKSKNAANLIDLIETAPYFGQVRFSAPTIRKGGSAVETFAITAEAVPGVILKD